MRVVLTSEYFLQMLQKNAGNPAYTKGKRRNSTKQRHVISIDVPVNRYDHIKETFINVKME